MSFMCWIRASLRALSSTIDFWPSSLVSMIRVWHYTSSKASELEYWVCDPVRAFQAIIQAIISDTLSNVNGPPHSQDFVCDVATDYDCTNGSGS
jgi:hypothetical protein